MTKVITTSFGTKFNPAIQRLGKQIENLELGCIFGVITESNLREDNRLNLLKNFIIENNGIKNISKGFLWYTWKPWVLLRTIIDLDENEVFVYLDAGTEVPLQGKNNFKRLIDLAKINGTFFFRNPQIIKDYTRPEVLDFFAGETIDFNKKQIAAGVHFMRNDFQTRKLLREWCRLSLFNNGYLFYDNGFVNHRHDQSILSIIVQKYKFHITDYPIWFPRTDYLSRELFFYPIHTFRNPYNFSLLSIYDCINKIPNRVWVFSNNNESLFTLVYKILLFINKFNANVLVWDEKWERIWDLYTEKYSINHYHRTGGDLRDLSESKIFYFRLKACKKRIKISKFGVFEDLDTGIIYFNQYRQFGKIEDDFFLNSPNSILNDNNNYLALLSLNDNNLFHFVYDLLFKALYLKHINEEFICIVKDDFKWKIDLLNAFGLKYIILKADIIEIEKSLIVNSPIYSGDPSIEVCTILRNYLPKDLINNKFPKKILLLRNQAKSRKGINDDDFQMLTENYGFTSIELEDFTISEQIAIFQNADVIVATHGAGLSWLFGCSCDTIIIELFSKNYLNFLYARISEKLNLKYYSFICESDFRRNRLDPDIIVSDQTMNGIISILKRNMIK